MSELPVKLPQRQFQLLYLDEVIDVTQLVNYRTVRAQGVNPQGIRVYYDPSWKGGVSIHSIGDPKQTFAGGEPVFESPFEIVMGPELKELMEQYPEYAYVIFAHELTHTTQPAAEDDPKFGTDIRGREAKFHSDIPREQEAIFWEAQQAAKFQWTREEYQQFLERLHFAAPRSHRFVSRLQTEMGKRTYAAYPALSRRPSAPAQAPGLSSRPVRVRDHVRRHLESPPSYCACRKSKSVDRVRRAAIRRMK